MRKVKVIKRRKVVKRVSEPIRFDNALPVFAGIAAKKLSMADLAKCAFLRDAVGRLTLILRVNVSKKVRDELAKEATARLGSYAGLSGEAVATPEELFDESLSNQETDQIEYINIGGRDVPLRVIDRRIVGQDWTRPNFSSIESAPPIFVFASCKGGVGRSTALAVAAAELSRRQLRVLLIDLDLEAPGIGAAFLKSTDLPKFGALDYYVENGMNGVDEVFLSNLTAAVKVSEAHSLVYVCPVVGSVGQRAPQNVLAKLARAYVDDVDSDGQAFSFLGQTRRLVSDLSKQRKYDVVLVDSRAGLNESTAAALIGLGGEILFFAIDTVQTIESYNYLFSHLGRLAPAGTPEFDWRHRIKMVQAKCDMSLRSRQRFRERMFEVFADHLYEETQGEQESFNFDIEDPIAPHYAWAVPFDSRFVDFDPISTRDQFETDYYRTAFGPFVESLLERLSAVRV